MLLDEETRQRVKTKIENLIGEDAMRFALLTQALHSVPADVTYASIMSAITTFVATGKIILRETDLA